LLKLANACKKTVPKVIVQGDSSS